MDGEFKLLLCMCAFLVGMIIGTCTHSAFADELEPYKVAVIDTGFSPIPGDDSAMKLCETGHYDFATKQPYVGIDEHYHGAHVIYLINKLANTENMCFLVYKVFGKDTDYKVIANAMIKAYKAGARAINMSLSVHVYHHKLKRVTKYLTDRGVKIYAAAGNEGQNLNNYCNIYPQCLKRMNSNLMIVGAVDFFGDKEKYSNYGLKLDVYDWGSIGTARGTSFASPRALGTYIRNLKLDKKKRK